MYFLAKIYWLLGKENR